MTNQNPQTQESKMPSHYVYYTERNKNGDDDWKRVGAAWPNKDGKGYTVKVQEGMLEIHLVMREPKPQS